MLKLDTPISFHQAEQRKQKNISWRTLKLHLNLVALTLILQRMEVNTHNKDTSEHCIFVDRETEVPSMMDVAKTAPTKTLGSFEDFVRWWNSRLEDILNVDNFDPSKIPQDI